MKLLAVTKHLSVQALAIGRMALLWLLVSPAHAGLLDYFKEEDGSTNWQYVANWSSGILILLLLIVITNLYFTRRSEIRSNRELTAIRANLEGRVVERTASLAEAKTKLEAEVEQHKITASRLRSSEGYLRNVLTSMPLMLVGLDAEGKVTQWNKRATKVTGIAADKALGNDLWAIYPSITVPRSRVEQTLKEGTPFTIKHSQRGQYYFDITLYPIQTDDISGVILLIDDVTARIEAENSLIQRDKLSTLGEMAAALSYDVAVPLTALRENLRALGDLGLAAHQQQLQIDAINQCEQAIAVANNMQVFTRIAGDQQKQIDVAELLDSVLARAASILSGAGGLRFSDIALDWQRPRQPVTIMGYPSELQQAFLGVLRHACQTLDDARSQGAKPAISIKLEDSFGTPVVRIHHNGRVLSDSEQKYLFEPVLHNNRNDIHSGIVAGQGEDSSSRSQRLSFPYYIFTEEHDCQVAVTSSMQTGTTFHIALQV